MLEIMKKLFYTVSQDRKKGKIPFRFVKNNEPIFFRIKSSTCLLGPYLLCCSQSRILQMQSYSPLTTAAGVMHNLNS